MIRNFTQHYPDVLAVAKNEAERHVVYSQPAAISHAVENIDSGFTSTEEGRNTLSTYILRWTVQDANAVSSWLESTAVVMKVFSAEGIQVRHNGLAAGQDVFHLHFHVIPRYGNNGFETADYETVPIAVRTLQAEKLKSYFIGNLYSSQSLGRPRHHQRLPSLGASLVGAFLFSKTRDLFRPVRTDSNLKEWRIGYRIVMVIS
jgi:hypothetical protein